VLLYDMLALRAILRGGSLKFFCVGRSSLSVRETFANFDLGSEIDLRFIFHFTF
jgi:hypothetical protein